LIIRFGTATGKYDFLGTRADQRSNLLSCRLDGCPGSLSEGVNRGSVSKFSGKEREHRVEYVRLDSRSGIVIQIDAIHSRAIRINSPSPDSKHSALDVLSG
jgi:hypothetical protein